MKTYSIYLEVREDGRVLPGMPLRIRQTVDEAQAFAYEEADDGNNTTFSAVPLNQLTTVQFFLFQAVDQALGIRLEGGESSSTAIRLDEGGLLLMVKGTVTASNITVNNASGAVANPEGLGAGT